MRKNNPPPEEPPAAVPAVPENPNDPLPPTAEEAKADGSPFFSADDPCLIDLDDLTIAEQAEVEELANVPLGIIFAGGIPSSRLLQALIFVVRRRKFPEITFDEAGGAKPDEYGWVMETDDDGKPRVPLGALLNGSPMAAKHLAGAAADADADD